VSGSAVIAAIVLTLFAATRSLQFFLPVGTRWAVTPML